VQDDKTKHESLRKWEEEAKEKGEGENRNKSNKENIRKWDVPYLWEIREVWMVEGGIKKSNEQLCGPNETKWVKNDNEIKSKKEGLALWTEHKLMKAFREYRRVGKGKTKQQENSETGMKWSEEEESNRDCLKGEIENEKRRGLRGVRADSGRSSE